jgi:hypothetical protein
MTDINKNPMRSVPLFIAIVVAFGLSFLKHISLAMYPLSIIIFYFYLPVLYASSRINILHHIKEKEIFHIKFYPMELSMWLVSTCFFAFILSHLLSDLLFPYRASIYHFSFFLITLGLGWIIYCERDAKRFHITSKKNIFETQGRILGFEFLFIMILLFAMNH